MATKIKTKSKLKAKKFTVRPTIKTKAKMPVKALNKKITKSNSKMKARKAEIVKRVTFTAQEFKAVQQMLTANDCQSLKEWITKRISDHKLQLPSVST